MKFLLKLKHYQLFTMTWGIAFLVVILSIGGPDLIIQLYPLLAGLFALGSLGWIHAIVIHLHDKLPVSSPINLEHFKKAFWVPIAYVIIMSLLLFREIDAGNRAPLLPDGLFVFLLVVLHIGSLVTLFYGIAIAAKTLRSIEMGRNARFSHYLGEMFLIWFSFLGYWVLQPRINKAYKADSPKVDIAG